MPAHYPPETAVYEDDMQGTCANEQIGSTGKNGRSTRQHRHMKDNKVPFAQIDAHPLACLRRIQLEKCAADCALDKYPALLHLVALLDRFHLAFQVFCGYAMVLTLSASAQRRHVWAWYCYSFAAEVFAACALAIFIPIALEKVARDIGYLSPDWTVPCSAVENADDGGDTICRARILGIRVDSASFSMYTKSIAVALQALCIITVGPLADSTYWRKRLLVLFAIFGSLSGLLFLALPTGSSITPILAALLTITGNIGYAVGTVCSNAFLPELAREVNGANGDNQGGAEAEPLLEETAGGDVTDGRPQGPVTRLTQAVVHGAAGAHPQTEELPPASAPIEPSAIAADIIDKTTRSDLSFITSRLSSTCTALGFFSGVTVLALLLVPVTLMGGSTFSLRLAVGISGAWWITFLVPAALGLPGSTIEDSVTMPSVKEGWRRVGRMVRIQEMKRLQNLFKFLLCWIFLSDGFHTTTYIAILYASSQLHMSATKVGIVGILVQLTAVASSILAPKAQRLMSWPNQQLLLRVTIAGGVLPLYACLGLLLPFGGLRKEGEMYIAAVWFGILFGPFNSYSRAVYAELIPPGHESSFFSLFALTDKSASFIGPFIVGVIADVTGNIRLGFLFLLVMLAVPVPILMRVDMAAGHTEARRWSQDNNS